MFQVVCRMCTIFHATVVLCVTRTNDNGIEIQVLSTRYFQLQPSSYHTQCRIRFPGTCQMRLKLKNVSSTHQIRSDFFQENSYLISENKTTSHFNRCTVLYQNSLNFNNFLRKYLHETEQHFFLMFFFSFDNVNLSFKTSQNKPTEIYE